MVRLPPYLRSHAGLLVAGVAAIGLSLAVVGADTAAMIAAASRPAPVHPGLYLLHSSITEGQNPLSFQVGGVGFRPGEQVTIRASLASGGHAGSASQVLPVHVVANDDGQVAATLDGGGQGTGDGFVIRATGDQHTVSIVDLVLPGASYTAPGGP